MKGSVKVDWLMARAVCQHVQCGCRTFCNFINSEQLPPPPPPNLTSLLTPNYIPNINFRNLPISTAPRCLVACWTRWKFSRSFLHCTGCSKIRHADYALDKQPPAESDSDSSTDRSWSYCNHSVVNCVQKKK